MKYTADSVPEQTDSPRLIMEGPHFAQLWESVLFDDDLSTSAKVLYAVLTRYAAWYGQGSVFPSREKLAKRAGLSVRTVATALAQLEERGHIQRQSRGKDEPQQVVLLAPTPLANSARPPMQDLQGYTREKDNREKPPIDPPWEPTPGDRSWAFLEGFNRGECEDQTAQFNDYRAAHGKRYKNLSAAWRNWMRRSREYKRQSNGRGFVSQADHNRGGTGKVVL